jgi:hypothetical protein
MTECLQSTIRQRFRTATVRERSVPSQFSTLPYGRGSEKCSHLCYSFPKLSGFRVAQAFLPVLGLAKDEIRAYRNLFGRSTRSG